MCENQKANKRIVIFTAATHASLNDAIVCKAVHTSDDVLGGRAGLHRPSCSLKSVCMY